MSYFIRFWSKRTKLPLTAAAYQRQVGGVRFGEENRLAVFRARNVHRLMQKTEKTETRRTVMGINVDRMRWYIVSN